MISFIILIYIAFIIENCYCLYVYNFVKPSFSLILFLFSVNFFFFLFKFQLYLIPILYNIYSLYSIQFTIILLYYSHLLIISTLFPTCSWIISLFSTIVFYKSRYIFYFNLSVKVIFRYFLYLILFIIIFYFILKNIFFILNYFMFLSFIV